LKRLRKQGWEDKIDRIEKTRLKRLIRKIGKRLRKQGWEDKIEKTRLRKTSEQ